MTKDAATKDIAFHIIVAITIIFVYIAAMYEKKPILFTG